MSEQKETPSLGKGEMNYSGHCHLALIGLGRVPEDTNGSERLPEKDEETLYSVDWCSSPLEFAKRLREAAAELEEFHRKYPDASVYVDID